MTELLASSRARRRISVAGRDDGDAAQGCALDALLVVTRARHPGHPSDRRTRTGERRHRAVQAGHRALGRSRGFEPCLAVGVPEPRECARLTNTASRTPASRMRRSASVPVRHAASKSAPSGMTCAPCASATARRATINCIPSGERAKTSAEGVGTDDVDSVRVAVGRKAHASAFSSLATALSMSPVRWVISTYEPRSSSTRSSSAASMKVSSLVTPIEIGSGQRPSLRTPPATIDGCLALRHLLSGRYYTRHSARTRREDCR